MPILWSDQSGEGRHTICQIHTETFWLQRDETVPAHGPTPFFPGVPNNPLINPKEGTITMTTNVKINGKQVAIQSEPDTPLLWAVRDELRMTGTKFGCGMAQCGACTVHIDGVAQRSCVTPVEALEDAEVTTIEGLDTPEGKAVMQAWRELEVAQCGYCQSGQIMSAASLLADTPAPTDEDIDFAMSGNLCRCATYHRIRAGIHRAADILKGQGQ
jgi:isoquinoline 1-oxidoreductase alpha subunit